MKLTIAMSAAMLGLAACCSTPPTFESAPETAWTFEDGVMFPADRSLVRPEDGVVLADGTLLVADQRHGLVALSPDGTVRPFGNFADAGYRHEPGVVTAGPNGVAFEPDGEHVLVADVFTGAIYRVDIASETTELLYQHSYGVNTAVKDSTGAVWFTQSAKNSGPDSEEQLFSVLDVPVADGALFRLPSASAGKPAAKAELMASDFYFANGIVVDEARGMIYVAETMGDRVTGFDLATATGEVSNRRRVAVVLGPDNIEMDEAGAIWAASPIGNAIVLIDPETGRTQPAFISETEASKALLAEFRRRIEAGEPRLELMGPDMWAPMPGLATGIILTPGGGPVYVSGLGNALVKLDAPVK